MFRLRPIEAPWGDYGRILYYGMSMHAGRRNGQILLERTGPSIFPITFPGAGDIVVTEGFKKQWERIGLCGVSFRPVLKHHIVELDWESWDASSDEPPECPQSGEPEDYILDQPHSEAAAKGLGDLWELVISEEEQNDIFYKRGTRIVLLSAKAKDWFLQNFCDYVTVVNERA